MKRAANDDGAADAARALNHLRRIFHAIHAQSAAIESSTGITGPQLWALHAVAEEPEGLPLGAIARKLVLHKANAGRLVDRLLTKKLVTCERPPRDRRLVIVRPTAKGRALLGGRAPRPAPLDLLLRLGELPKRERDAIEQSLAAVVSLLGAEKAPTSPIVDERRAVRRK
jgi:DNA-binding MarR family transcriptional regulator